MMPFNMLIHGALCPFYGEEFMDHEAFLAHVKNSKNASWYPIILANPYANSSANKEFFQNYLYLNSRTGNVQFYVPGLVKTEEKASSSLSNFGLFNFLFDPKKFVSTLEWIEQECKGYTYSEGADIVIIPSEIDENGEGYNLDYDNYLYINLENIKSNINLFIQQLKHLLESVPSHNDLSSFLNCYSSGTTDKEDDKRRAISVFIAGSTELLNERNQIRSQLQQVNNAHFKNFQSLTYEDFKREILIGGRQKEYNAFIETYADFIVFVIDRMVGGITYEEFKVAINSYIKNGRPNIFVYHRKSNILSRFRTAPDIKKIINLIKKYNQYYIQYTSIEELGHLVYRDFSTIKLHQD